MENTINKLLSAKVIKWKSVLISTPSQAQKGNKNKRIFQAINRKLIQLENLIRYDNKIISHQNNVDKNLTFFNF